MWQDRLSAEFPTVKFTVCPKADSLFKIVGAASIVAKVTRDRYIEGWVDAEGPLPGPGSAGGDEAEVEELIRGSGYPSGTCCVRGARAATCCLADGRRNVIRPGTLLTPDPKTQAFLRQQLDPVFGYRGMVRFSWATVKVLLEKQGHPCQWADDVAQPSAAAYFAGDDKGRPKLWRDLGVSGVGEL